MSRISVAIANTPDTSGYEKFHAVYDEAGRRNDTGGVRKDVDFLTRFALWRSSSSSHAGVQPTVRESTGRSGEKEAGVVLGCRRTSSGRHPTTTVGVNTCKSLAPRSPPAAAPPLTFRGDGQGVHVANRRLRDDARR